MEHYRMALDIQEREREGIVILELKGKLIVGEPVSDLREKVREMVAAGKLNIVLNLQNLEYIDSTGLGGLVISYTTVKKAGGALKILNLSQRNVELLVLTKLTTVFEIFDEEQDAVNSFFPNRQIRKFDILSFVQEQKNPES
jgi:anti-sigma B factor antagonist